MSVSSTMLRKLHILLYLLRWCVLIQLAKRSYRWQFFIFMKTFENRNWMWVFLDPCLTVLEQHLWLWPYTRKYGSERIIHSKNESNSLMQNLITIAGNIKLDHRAVGSKILIINSSKKDFKIWSHTCKDNSRIESIFFWILIEKL